MNPGAALPSGLDLRKVQHGIKWAVYTLLLINFGGYIVEDWTAAMHTLGPDAGLLDWAGAFATSIDEAGWFILLFMFELETYLLGDETWTGWVARVVHGARLACYAMLAHTVYAYAIAVMALYPAVTVDDAADPCALADTGVSWVYNLGYADITAQNCTGLTDADEIYWVENATVVSDLDGLMLERDLAWVDLAEAIIWLVIVLAIETVVRLQNRDVTGGALMTLARQSQLVLYLSLIAIGIYWATLSHWFYLWDELVWIGGFAAIDMNLSEWRDEIVAEETT
jgi:hypothetical protein